MNTPRKFNAYSTFFSFISGKENIPIISSNILKKTL